MSSTAATTPTIPSPTMASSEGTKPKELAKPAPKQESALKSFLSGGFGGVCIVLVGHPLDLVKVRMQTGVVKGNSVFGVLGKTMRNEGIAGLYRGVSAPLLAVSPMFAVSFWGYDMGQRIVRWYDDQPVAPLSISQCVIAGGLSAIPTTALMAPSERIKCLLQVPNHPYKGFLDCTTQVLRQGGVRSLFKGTALTLMRDTPGSMAWFGVYEYAKKEMMRVQGIDPATGTLSPLAVLTAGGLAGMACWTVAIPSDVLKSRYQSAPEGTYTGLMHVYSEVMKTEGIGGFFTGIRPALIRAFPANAACFFGMEVARKALAFLD
ncbi:Congested-like trachea protein [Seminavis robusta]|uniref:Congested-like trachea protein n=1 Tax=Seminavis robusta TaxID=568900 RepID=A0A9N8DXJ2_9STRA|nr:Congested-like trachea protein [Seminavis robusta]|eukprot:Sro423_g139780.1 Congested-like trachea protein (320) ;mRNA; f:27546-28695